VKTLLVLACLSIKLMTTESWPTTATQPPANSDLIVEPNDGAGELLLASKTEQFRAGWLN
jgi:hypothetical protein